MVMVIIAGHIDLSVGSVAAFVGIVVAMAMRDWGLPWSGGILLGLAVGAVDRRVAGLLGRLRRRPRVHRDPGRHAHLPRRATSSSASPTPSRCREEFQEIGAGYLPEVGPDTGYNNLTLLLGVARLRWPSSGGTLRTPAQPAQDRRRPRGPRGSPDIRLGLICVVDPRRHAAASPPAVRHRLPDLRHHPRRPGPRLLVRRDPQHDHRPAHLRGRRQPARRRAVRRHAASGSTSSS